MKNISVFLIVLIFVCHSSAGPFLIHSGGTATNLVIDGTNVVWNNGLTVYLHDISTGTETALTTNGAWADINGQIAVWQRIINTYDVEIWGENLTTSQEFFIAAAKRSSGNANNPVIFGEVVVWQSLDSTFNIYAKNLFSGLSKGIAVNATINEMMPDISNDLIVYEVEDYHHVVGYNLTTSQTFSICESVLGGLISYAYPQIDRNTVVWGDHRDGNWNIYGADIKDNSNVSVFPICTNIATQVSPSISGDIVVWSDDRNGNFDIYGKVLSTGKEFVIYSGAGNQSRPKISGKYVVWSDCVDDQCGIYGIDIEECLVNIPGDIDGNCKVDFLDFSILASHWMECNLVLDELCD